MNYFSPGDSPSGVKLPINSLKLNIIPKISFRCSDNCSASCSAVDLVAEYRFVSSVLPLRSKMWRACTVMSLGVGNSCGVVAFVIGVKHAVNTKILNLNRELI